MGSIPGLGRSPGEGNDNAFQYSCLENPMDIGAWQAAVPGVSKSRTRLSDYTTNKAQRSAESRPRSQVGVWQCAPVPAVWLWRYALTERPDGLHRPCLGVRTDGHLGKGCGVSRCLRDNVGSLVEGFQAGGTMWRRRQHGDEKKGVDRGPVSHTCTIGPLQLPGRVLDRPSCGVPCSGPVSLASGLVSPILDLLNPSLV